MIRFYIISLFVNFIAYSHVLAIIEFDFYRKGTLLFLPPCLLVACRVKSPSGNAYAAPLDAKNPSKLDLK